MRLVIIQIQSISIIAMLLECWLIARSFKGKLHFYLFFSCAATLVNNIGYLFQLRSTSEESYFYCLSLSYFGKVWIAFAFFMFITQLVKLKLSKTIRTVLTIVNIISYTVIITTKVTGWYYETMSFEIENGLPHFTHDNGFYHHIFIGVIAALSIIAMVILINARMKAKNTRFKKCISMVIVASFIQSGFALVEMLKLIRPLKGVYDVSMLGYPMAAIFMLIAILKYDLLETEFTAREYAIDELSEGIIAADEDGGVRYYNKPALALFPDLENKPDDVIAFLRNYIEKKETFTLNNRFYTPEENKLVKNNKDIGTIYAIIDDTEKIHYMDELNEERIKADNANKAKSAFLANMSHEIRTPINAVLGMDEMIIRESKEESTLIYARDIQAAGHTLLSLINDILDFSKIEEGKMEIIPTQYELSSLIVDLVNMIRVRSDKKGLIFNVNVDKGIPHLLYGDEIRIKQIVLNLLTNAVKYTEKGEVTLEVSFRKESDENISLRFKVSDTGIGMKKEDMERIFSPFSRLEEKRNRSIEGTGLGISIVKELLFLMGSKLEVESEYGKGSVFSFEISQKVEKENLIGDFNEKYKHSDNKKEKYREMFHAPNARILVVDDTEINLQVVKSLLKKTKIGIDTASSGSEALEMAARQDYDMIFIDHMMPKMDGIETLEKLKEQTEKLPVCVALTANAVSGAREMYIDAGFTDYMSKPVNGKTLEEMLLDYLPKEKVETDYVEDIYEEKKAELNIPEIPGLDVNQGIKNCGSAESFLSVLNTFHRTTADKTAEIEKFFKDKDIENYTIKVHALKSSARVIGANTLSELARKLEEAGKYGDIKFIEEKTDELLDIYRDVDRGLRFLDKDEESKEEMSEELRKDAFSTIAEMAGSTDFSMMEDVIKQFRGYRLNENDKRTIDEIEKRLMELDFNGISELAVKAMN